MMSQFRLGDIVEIACQNEFSWIREDGLNGLQGTVTRVTEGAIQYVWNEELGDDEEIDGVEYDVTFDNTVQDFYGNDYTHLIVYEPDLILIKKKEREPTGFGKFLRTHNL